MICTSPRRAQPNAIPTWHNLSATFGILDIFSDMQILPWSSSSQDVVYENRVHIDVHVIEGLIFSSAHILEPDNQY